MRFVAFVFALTAGPALAGEPGPLLDKIKAVAKEGAGNQEAGAAWKDLVAMGGPALMPTLSAFDAASPVAANWLRSAVNAIAEKEVAAGRKLPAVELEKFVLDSKHAPVGRRLAYELLSEADAKAPERLLPGMLNDPSNELRRDAVAVAMAAAEKLTGDAAKTEFTKLFEAVRDQTQAEKIAKALDGLGVKADLTNHFGVITKWAVVGPFDSTKGAGFEKSYEPEARVELSATYKGKDGADLKWKTITSDDKYGKVDLNKVISKHKDSAAYAFTVVESAKETPVEVRLGCICAVKVFLNGKPVFVREEYHHGERFDQYVGRGTLKAGKNELLVKVCQNNQSEPWAQNWQFSLRLCDATGGALPVKVVLADK